MNKIVLLMVAAIAMIGCDKSEDEEILNIEIPIPEIEEGSLNEEDLERSWVLDTSSELKKVVYLPKEEITYSLRIISANSISIKLTDDAKANLQARKDATGVNPLKSYKMRDYNVAGKMVKVLEITFKENNHIDQTELSFDIESNGITRTLTLIQKNK